MKLQKDIRGNWHAKSSYDLGGNRMLEIGTMKRSNGMLTTTAVVNVKDMSFPDAMVHRMFTDYNKFLVGDSVRCTEKAVREQHEFALTMLDRIKLEVKTHYELLGEASAS
jgi:hypothetical protein